MSSRPKKNAKAPAQTDTPGAGGSRPALVFLGALAVTPFALARYFGPVLGVVGALGALLAWIYFGPRPTRNSNNELVCLLGLAVLLGILIAWGVRIVYHLVH